MRTSPPPVSRAVKLGAFALVVGMLVVMLGAVEVFLRWRSSDRWGFVDALDLRTIDPDIGGVRMQPNLRSPRLDTNSLGYRGPLPEMPKPPGRIRLAFLGASTTFCHEASDEAHTWPALVHAAMQEKHPDVEIDYINGAISGWSMPVIRRAYAKDISPLRPDIVFVYEATNALSLDTRALAMAQGLVDEAPDKVTVLGQYSLFFGLLEKNYKVWRRSAGATSGEAKLRFDPRELSARYKEELRALVDAIVADGATPVLVTFAPRLRPDQSELEQTAAMITTAYYMPYLGVEGALKGFDAYNQRMREVSQETTSPLVEDIDAIPGDAAHYTDSVHFTDQGAAAMAARVSKVVLASPRIAAVLTATTALRR